MDKTKIMFLKPGASVNFNSVDLGYTSGISFLPDNKVVNLKNQRYKGFVDTKLVSVGGTVKVDAMEISADNYALLPLTDAASLTKAVLIIYGERMDGVYITLTMNNAVVENIGEVKFDKAENATLSLTFRCLLDSSGILGSIVET